MIEQICAYIHNFFTKDEDIHSGTFTIEDDRLDVDFLTIGQYYRIRGSKFNDGIYRYMGDDLINESFTGEIWDMRPPRAFLDLVGEIVDWNAKYGEIMNSPYSSESFGGYSYKKAQGYAGAGGGMISTWQTVFGSRLNQWRKLA